MQVNLQQNLLIFLVGIFMESFLCSCVYLVVFWTVRKFSGGFHAKTYWVCRIVTVGTYIFVFFASKMIGGSSSIFVVICNLFSVITMIAFAPIRHSNIELTGKEEKANQLFAVLITLVFTVLSIILMVFGHEEGFIISLTLFAVAVLMYAGLLANERKEEKHKKYG